MDYFGRNGLGSTLFFYVTVLIVAGCGLTEGFGNNVNMVTLRMECRIKSHGDTSRIALTCLIPKSIENRQRVFDITYSTSPARVFDEGENRYAVFDIPGPAEEENIIITAKLGLMGHSLKSVLALRKNGLNGRKTSLTPEETSRYLTSERYILVNHPEIEKASKKIKKPYYLIEPDPTKQQLDMVKKIFKFVLRNMSYSGYNYNDKGALEALRTHRGDCSEYSDLFIALCRAKGLPARVAEGLTSEYHVTPKHAWAEVFISGLGWIPFDPTFADTRGAYFDSMKPIYIGLSRIRNDKTLGGRHYYYYYCWGAMSQVKMTYKFRKCPTPPNHG